MQKERLVLGGGCFWCVEAVYSNVNGVLHAISGYTGGKRANPSYESVCTGATGHAEVVDILFDTQIISREELLDIFFVIHNSTTLNSQGADRGTQYRSVIYYETQEEKELIMDAITKAQKNYTDTIVTEVAPLGEVYPAEAYHQNYYQRNPSQGYCQAVIAPKMQKFMNSFPQNVG